MWNTSDCISPISLRRMLLQDWRQLLGDETLLPFGDGATGPVDQFEVIGRGIRNGVFGAIFAVVAEFQ